MPRVKVKICGIRSLAEAQAAQALGADALGFNFWEGSPRYVAPANAQEIIRRLDPFVACIGVFVNSEADRIRDIHAQVCLSAVQLHGDESPDYCRQLIPVRIIKALRITEGFQPPSVSAYPVAAVLLDAGVRGRFGGTGETFDWRLAIETKQYAPVILAGGLTAQNVAEAITRVRPWAIDVCSGVEFEPGLKDLDKMTQFMARVDEANSMLLAESAYMDPIL